MQQANGIRFATLLHQRGNRATHAALVQRNEHRSTGVHALVDFHAHVPGHQGFRKADLEIVGIKAFFPANLQHIPEPARGDQSRARAFTLNDRIDHQGRAVNHRVSRRRGAPLPGRDLAHALTDRPRGVIRRGQAFVDFDLASRLVNLDEVGKGSADIAAQRNHIVPLPDGLIVWRRLLLI